MFSTPATLQRTCHSHTTLDDFSRRYRTTHDDPIRPGRRAPEATDEEAATDSAVDETPETDSGEVEPTAGTAGDISPDDASTGADRDPGRRGPLNRRDRARGPGSRGRGDSRARGSACTSRDRARLRARGPGSRGRGDFRARGCACTGHDEPVAEPEGPAAEATPEPEASPDAEDAEAVPMAAAADETAATGSEILATGDTAQVPRPTSRALRAAIVATSVSDLPDEFGDDFEAAISHTVAEFKEGDIVEGTVVTVDADGAMVDVGYKSEGMIPTEDSRSGPTSTPPPWSRWASSVEALVLNKEDEEGRLILSKKRAQYERAWGRVQKITDQGRPSRERSSRW